MNIFVEFLVTLWELCKGIFWGVVYSVLPAPQKSVQGDTVLITGSGSGLGRLMAVEFAKRGAKIVGWDINETGNQETADTVKKIGGEIYTYVCDISNKDEVKKCGDQVMRDVGDVHILINNAGMVTGKRFLDCPDGMIQKTMEVNTMAHFWTTKTFLPSMLAADHGHIVIIASIAGVIGGTSLADYCASKFANVGFTESLDLEIRAAGKQGVFTTTVCPYFIATGMFEGCQTRFPWILPVLDPQQTAERIVRAVLTNQRVLFIPRILYLLTILKAVLPVDACMALHKFFGAIDFMDTFVGRAKAD